MLSTCPRCEVDLPFADIRFCPECGMDLKKDYIPLEAETIHPASTSAPRATPAAPPPIKRSTVLPPPIAQSPRPVSTISIKDLMPCPACGQMISRQAVSCPTCAHPIAYNPPIGSVKKPMLIEKTAKRYKLIQLLGVLMLIIGVPMCSGSASLGPDGQNAAASFAALSIAGLFIFALGRFLAWWNHG